ncbi:hypothetical protein DAETH_39200 (plasmid) [Deinococcus aetherius]|uniref:Secreted protein n=1 Tax=Deinococcus aetherius TaxID=200252 RepID=A0ABN6RKY6_9DEIO|nr:hypothetical protein [Deinococcus aetherius]BDP43951.1 hypothetical protein DAETH_39200 [Deinococcus aetherius]
MGIFLFNLAAVQVALAMDSRGTAWPCPGSNAVVVVLLWEEEGPHLRRRLRDGWKKAASRFSRPVIPLPS